MAAANFKDFEVLINMLDNNSLWSLLLFFLFLNISQDLFLIFYVGEWENWVSMSFSNGLKAYCLRLKNMIWIILIKKSTSRRGIKITGSIILKSNFNLINEEVKLAHSIWWKLSVRRLNAGKSRYNDFNLLTCKYYTEKITTKFK